MIFDKGVRGGGPISDFGLTRGEEGRDPPIFGWHNMWTAPKGVKALKFGKKFAKMKKGMKIFVIFLG